MSKVNGMPKGITTKYTTESFIQACILKFGEGTYDYSRVNYVNQSGWITVICPKHGPFSTTGTRHLTMGKGCPHKECVGTKIRLSKAFSTKDWIDWCTKVHKGKYDYSKSVYVNQATPVCIICPVHGEFYQLGGNHLGGFGCARCGFIRTASATVDNKRSWVKKARSVHGTEYDYSRVVYTVSTDYVEIVCRKPNHGSFWVTANGHLHNKGKCPKCYGGRSAAECTLLNALPFKPLLNVKGLLENKRQELDIYFKEHHLAVEVNGRYWHTEQFVSKDLHYSKTLECKRVGVQLLHFWDFELDENFDLCVSMVKSKLGLNKRLFARKLKVRQLTVVEKSEFFNSNHLQGNDKCTVAYGLVTVKGNKIACAMSFTKPRFNKSYDWELSRFACAKGITVVGGASRLLKAFETDCNPKSLISYADLRVSNGNLYKKIGFSYSHRSKPNYFYVNGHSILSRYQCQKHKLPKLLGEAFDPRLSEVANMSNNGWYRAFDCGNLVFDKHYTFKE